MTRQYARLLSQWLASIGLDPRVFGTHSLRRTKATMIYRRTGNLRAVQLLLGHRKIDSTEWIALFYCHVAACSFDVPASVPWQDVVRWQEKYENQNPAKAAD